LTTDALAKSDGVDVSMASRLESVGIGFGERLSLGFGLPDPDGGRSEEDVHLFERATGSLQDMRGISISTPWDGCSAMKASTHLGVQSPNDGKRDEVEQSEEDEGPVRDGLEEVGRDLHRGE